MIERKTAGKNPSQKPVKIAIMGATGTLGTMLTERISAIASRPEMPPIHLVLHGRDRLALEGIKKDLQSDPNASAMKISVSTFTKSAPLSNASLVFNMAGIPRKSKEQTREELVDQNRGITQNIAKTILRRAPNALVISVSNPVEPLVEILLNRGLHPSKTIGFGLDLDINRAKFAISKWHYKKTGQRADPGKIIVQGWGEHNPKFVFPEFAVINGKRVDFGQDYGSLIKEVHEWGGKVINATGATRFGPTGALQKITEQLILGKTIPLHAAVRLPEGHKVAIRGARLEQLEITKPIVSGTRVDASLNGIQAVRAITLNPQMAKTLNLPVKKRTS